MSKLHNLLEDPLFSVRSGGKLKHCSLPEVLALLAQDKVGGFAALQPHQEHAFHAFLVLLAAQVMHAEGLEKPPRDAETWRKGLLGLTKGKDEPWHLVVEDLKKPAFLQPPPEEADLNDWKDVRTTPDSIDILVTAKNHDVKQHRIHNHRPEHWVFALISLQTMNGYSSPGSYGITRMNKGAGNRPGIAVDTSLSPGGRFRKHLEDILPKEKRSELVRLYSFKARGGLGLVWLRPWDGTDSIPLKDLDPNFIEICRRFRMVVEDGRLCGKASLSETTRIEEGTGCTGDPWTPIDKSEVKALTLSGEGFTYPKVCELLFSEKYQPPLATQAREDSRELYWNGTAFVRGQGKTEGFHHRIVPIPSEAALEDPEQRHFYLTESQDRVQVAGDMKNRVLKAPLLMLLQGVSEPSKLDFKDSHADAWLDAYEQRVDDCFFKQLFEDAKLADEGERRARWVQRAHAIAEEVLMQAMREAPVSTARRFKVEALALSLFHGAAYSKFPILKPQAQAKEPA